MIIMKNKLVNKYWKDIEMLPLFINNNKQSHLNCREISREIFVKLSVLFEPIVLSLYKINKLTEIVLDKIAEILEIDDDIAYLYYNHILDIFSFYLNETEIYEDYECSENILRFLTHIKKYINIQE